MAVDNSNSELPVVAEEAGVEQTLRLGGDVFDKKKVKEEPIFRMLGNAKIPVSKATGKLWESRIDQATTARQDIEKCWDEAYAYYDNDQMSHRNASTGTSGGNKRFTRHLGDSWSETENVVFSNISTILPMLYAKNPTAEFTASNEDNKELANLLSTVINKLFNTKHSPGVNLKSKARRGILNALLTNTAYLKIGWVQKEDSAEQGIAEIQRLAAALEKAKDKKEIIEIEGEIIALEDKISFLSPSGPTISMKSPYRIYTDPTSSEPDMSDCNWIAEWDMLPTAYLNAVYAKKEDDQYKSVYEPTHILKAGTNLNSIEDEVNNFSLVADQTALEAARYGYKNDQAFKSAQHTKVWYIWDKTTRRVMLFADNKWDWPLWVWDDPLKILGFFPYTKLWFHETPEGSQPKGETTYYLDQQDAINDIHSEVNKMRKWAKSNIFFQKGTISQEDVEQVLKGPDGTARGVSIAEGLKLGDVIKSFEPPSINRPELWNVDNRFAAINRITGISDAQRGAQFKTNTTNEAIDFYQKNTDIRIDEKIDAIEDWLGQVAFALAQLIMRYWTAEDVAKLVGPQLAQSWVQINDPDEFRMTFNFQVVGGSTDKPTSKMKKKQALEIAQACGQFANAIPALGMIAVKALSQAFDEVVISEQDWQELRQSMQDQQQKAGAGPGEGGGEGNSGNPQQQEQQQADPAQVKEQLAQAIKQLPPEAKAQLEEMIASGMSPTDALKDIMGQMQQQQPQA